MDGRIQSILFDRTLWDITTSVDWIKTHGYKYYKVDIKPKHLRFRQHDPDIIKYNYVTKEIGDGIKFILEYSNNFLL